MKNGYEALQVNLNVFMEAKTSLNDKNKYMPGHFKCHL
jgi:hypothetical protein